MSQPVRSSGRIVVKVVVAASVLVASLSSAPSSAIAQTTRTQRGQLVPTERPACVTKEVEASIERGLKFLAESQRADGAYGKSSWGSDTYPTAISSLAGLAFLASGSTPTRGRYAKNLQKITSYLLENCLSNEYWAPGLISNRSAREQRPMYSHAFAMTYLAQIFGQEKDAKQRERIRKVLQNAVKLTAKSQTEQGGWGYTPNGWEDEGTLVVTQLQALRACRDVGIKVDKKIIDLGVNFLKLSTNPDGSVKYRASSSRYQVRPGVTCAAVVALWNAGEYDSELIRRISRYMHANIESQWGYGHHAEYVQYYLSQAKFVLGGKQWLSFYKRSADMMLAEQDRAEGSWDGADGGDLYGTSIALLSLQLPYNRLPVYQR
jgi:hypothetical protein